jgi:hypothetical protein
MLKRILLILAMGAALVACAPAGTGTSPVTETLAPVESPTESAPAESPAAS